MTVVGVDLGGTNLRAVAIDPRGEIVETVKRPNGATGGAQATIETIGDLVEELELAGGKPLRGIGLAVSGPVDVRTGVVDNPYTLAGWPPTDVRGRLRSRFSVPVVVENDANAAAVGEWSMGVGQGSSRFAVVTLGTGIGVGLVVDGVVQRGPDGRHGEAGHHTLDPAGPPCYCGARGCWEVLAAGSALARMGRERGFGPGGAQAVVSSARAGDPVAEGILHELGTWLGRGLVNLVSFCTPDVIALAGGLVEEIDVIEPPIRAELERHARLVPTGTTRLTVAANPIEAGALGAAHLALSSRQ